MNAIAKTRLEWMSAIELSQLIRSRTISPVELVKHSLARVEKVETRINAFVTTTPDLALSMARRVEDKIMRGEDLPPLAGLPVSIKDNIAVENVPLTFGSCASAKTPAPFNASVIENLTRAGACIVGKTTMTEFGCKASSDSPLTGLTRNPWNLQKSSAGSSSGAAASVAAGVTPFAVGTDGGGSVRVPAAFCGLVGLKPQFGRVPIYPQPASTLLHIGPIARSVADAAFLLSGMVGFDPRDATSFPSSVNGWEQIQRLPPKTRIAWSGTLGFGRPTAEVEKAIEDAASAFEAIGCEVFELKETFEDPYPIHAMEFFAGVSPTLKAALHQEPSILDRDVVARLKESIGFTIDDYSRSTRARHSLRQKFLQLFASCDFVLTPTVPVAAFDADLIAPPGWTEAPRTRWPTYTAIHNLTGFPAISVPCGKTSEGLPIGLQIVAAPHHDRDVLMAAAAYERSSPWTTDRPHLED